MVNAYHVWAGLQYCLDPDRLDWAWYFTYHSMYGDGLEPAGLVERAVSKDGPSLHTHPEENACVFHIGALPSNCGR